MDIEFSTLPSGLRAVSVTLPGFDSAAIAVFVKAGARNETAANNGIAHFLEHMAFKGTTSRSALQIGAEIETLGSNINAYTSHDVTCYFVTGLKDTIDRSLAILGDVLCASVFDPADIAVEKGVILQEIRRSADNPLSVAYHGYGRTAYPDQALGRPVLGRADFIEAATRDDFVAFVAEHYAAESMVVVGTGDFSHASFVELVARNFDTLPRGAGPRAPEPARYAGGAIRNPASFEQVSILLGLQSVAETDPAVHAHQVLARALGGGMSSPLFQEVREKRGLVYSVSAQSDHGADYGDLIISAGTTAQHVEELLDVACGELTKVAAHVTEADLTRAKNSLRVRLATAKERPFSLAQSVAERLFAHGEIIAPEVEMRAIEAVTMEDVRAAAQAVIATTPTISLAGPAPDIDYQTRVRAALG